MANSNAESILQSFGSHNSFYPVGQLLEPYVFPYQFGVIDFPEIGNFAARPIPTGNLAMVIHFGSDIQLFNNEFKDPKTYKYFVVGIHALNRLTYIQADSVIDNIVVAFKPGGFSRLFNYSAYNLLNKVVHLDKLLSIENIASIYEISRTTDVENRLSKLTVLLTRLLEQSTFSTRKNHLETLDLIHQKKGNIGLNEISNILGVSLRTLERSFQINVGISPKEYIRIIRFNYIFEYLLQHSFEGWQEITHQFGYYDQSHFIRDFKAITGYTPGEFIHYTEHGMIFLDRYQIVYQLENLKNR